jgi:hypothetical protein
LARAAIIVRDRRVEIDEDADPGGRGRRRLREIEAARHAIDIVARIDGDLSGFRIDSHGDADRNAVFGDTWHRVVPRLVRPGARRELCDRSLRATRAVGHPILDECVDGLGAVALDEFGQALFADPAGTDLSLVVAMPDLACPDLGECDPNDVRLALVTLLDADAGEMQTLFIDGRRVREVSGRQRRTHVRVMTARKHPKEMPALDEYRNDHIEIGVMGRAEIRTVVEKGVALGDVVEILGDRTGGKIEGGDVDREAILHADQAVIMRQQADREVARVLDDRRAARLENAVGHFPANRLEPPRQHGEHHWFEGVGRFGRHRRCAHRDDPLARPARARFDLINSRSNTLNVIPAEEPGSMVEGARSPRK